MISAGIAHLLLVVGDGLAGVVRRRGHLDSRPLGEDGEEAATFSLICRVSSSVAFRPTPLARGLDAFCGLEFAARVPACRHRCSKVGARANISARGRATCNQNEAQ